MVVGQLGRRMVTEEWSMENEALVVLATGQGNPPAVWVWTSGSVQFGSRSGQKPNLLCLGGVVTRTGHKPKIFRLECTWTVVPYHGSCNFGSN